MKTADNRNSELFGKYTSGQSSINGLYKICTSLLNSQIKNHKQEFDAHLETLSKEAKKIIFYFYNNNAFPIEKEVFFSYKNLTKDDPLSIDIIKEDFLYKIAICELILKGFIFEDPFEGEVCIYLNENTKKYLNNL